MHPVTRLALRASRALYALTSMRYSADLRRCFGADMRALFAHEARRRAESGGLRGLAGLWLIVARDLATPLPGPIGARADEAEAGAPGGPSPKGLGNQGGEETMSGRRWTRGWLEDLGFAWRSLVREPRFSGLVVGVLAVGIALNTAAFAAFNAYVLRPLPFPDADRLVSVRNGQALSWTEVDDVFEQPVSWDLDVFTLVGDGRPLMAPGAWVTPGFLDAYGIGAQVGRTFRADEAGRDGAPVAMISHRLWQERFAGDPDIVGRAFSAFTSDRPDHAELFTIVGVLPSDFWYLNEYTEVLAPIRVERTVYTGRLRADVPLERAEAMLTDMSVRRMDVVPPDFAVRLVPLQEAHTASVRPTLLVLQAAVLLVLLIACANAAVLLLVRSTRRERELGLRRALGASGPRLARQLVFEGGLIAASAAAAGVALAWLALDAGRATIESRLGSSIPGGADALTLDATVLAAAAGLAAVVGVAFGLVPLASALGSALSSTLTDGSRGGTESRGRRRLRAGMVAGEVALSLALLTGAGLMVRSALHLQGRDLGFDPGGVVRGQLGLRAASYPEPEDRVAVFTELRDRIGEVTGVERVGLVSSSLFTTRFNPRSVEGLGPRDDLSHAEAVTWIVDERYFDALGIGLLRGRAFDEGDGATTEPVAVVSERLARDLWGDEDPLGRGVRVPPFVMPGEVPPEPGPWARVVGVVAEVQRGVGGPGGGDLYTPMAQAAPLWMNAMIRTHDGLVAVQPRVEAAIAAVDNDIPFASVSRLDESVERAMQPTRYVATLLAGFSVFALLLAVVGLYGVVAYAVRQRRRDVAIRIALGADRDSVTTLFLRQGLLVVALGLGAGTLGGYYLGRALEGQLHGVRPGDPATHVLLAVVLALTAAAAVWIPSRRAAGADPMGVLRED